MVEAYVMIRVEPGTSPKVVKKLKNDGKTKEIKESYGKYDIIAYIEAETREELRERVYGIRENKEVKDTTTMIVAARNKK